jgi:hypothetical protein
MADIVVKVSPKEAGPLKQADQPHAHTPKVTQKFSASVTGDSTHAGVTWDIAQGGGRISASGEFEPPEMGHGKSTISATSIADKTKSDTATVEY